MVISQHLLLYKNGRLWVDSDAVLLRHVYPVTIGVSALAFLQQALA